MDHSMTIEEQILEQAGNELAREIDREILWGMLQGIGWRRYMLDKLQDNNHAIDITCWLKTNCQGSYYRNGRDFLFESEKDATMFILRWM
jgi:hypothetical protein